MFQTIIIAISSLACGIAACHYVSICPNKQGRVESLQPISWVAGIAGLVGVNLLSYYVDWAWIPVACLIGILAAEFFCEMNYFKFVAAFSSAIALTITTILCFALEADKNGSPKVLWMISIPLLLAVVIGIVGKVKTIPKDKMEKLQKKFKGKLTVWNVVSALFATAAVITIIILWKEVF